MIDVTIPPPSQELMDTLEIDHDTVVTTVNDRHRGLVDHGLTRLAAVHWFDGPRIIFADCGITKREKDEANNRMYFREVAANIVLELKPDLPAGKITRDMKMEQILGVIAESFGHPVTCHPDEAPAYLYSGPWDGQSINFQANGETTLCVCGSMSPDNARSDLVWAFDIDRYREWFVQN